MLCTFNQGIGNYFTTFWVTDVSDREGLKVVLSSMAKESTIALGVPSKGTLSLRAASGSMAGGREGSVD